MASSAETITDFPSDCPECGRTCTNRQSLMSHYSQAHEPPYPWPDTTKRGHEWPTQRRKALERDGYECRACGSTSELQVHHIGDRDDHSLDKLETLCRPCHDERHPRGRWGGELNESELPNRDDTKEADF